ncbi:MAG: DUF1028 domain-containing protein [candidate division KSB1 bacterium]|nr:DUF1028 domain-containing protein [candidate division KSB1 bacterium]
MKKIMPFFAVVLIAFMLSPVMAGERRMPVSTYSIVARDSVTGELGVAVQSNWFSVGGIVSWAESGIGAVATQSFVEPAYGPLGLALMRAGKTAPEALKALLSIDPNADVRQVAMVDAQGNVAVHTGAKCIIYAGHVKGEQFSCQANLMEKDTVPEAMAKAYRNARGSLADRLMAALEAAQAEGGDIRGKQSAAILVVSGKKSGTPWNERIVDIRVDDHSEPLKEIKRLLQVQKVYNYANHGDELMTEGKVEEAMKAYKAAMNLAPDNTEMIFWPAVTLASIGRVDEALPLFKEVFKRNPKWGELVKRLPHSGLLPDDPKLIRKILSVMP